MMNTLFLRRENAFARDAGLVLLSGLLIALVGQFSIPLPFTPVPIAFRLQTILFLSVLLGSKRATLAVLTFLSFGAMGFPVFAAGGLLGPNGGYIVGYLAAAFVVGWMSERSQKTLPALVVGTLIVYSLGALYLATLIGFQKAILLGVLPFILGDILKTAVVVKLLQKRHAQKSNI